LPIRTRVLAGVRVIDARGKFIIPGLADMHNHLGTAYYQRGRGPGPEDQRQNIAQVLGLGFTLRTGDIGPVVCRYVPGGYELEFVTGGGDTVAVRTLSDADVRPLAAGKSLHARPLSWITASPFLARGSRVAFAIPSGWRDWRSYRNRPTLSSALVFR